MAAVNKKCHDKECLCATCYFMCSRCLVPDKECDKGVHECSRYKQQYNTLEEILEDYYAPYK